MLRAWANHTSINTQTQALRVVKDIKNYLKALEEMVKASKSLGDSIKTVYEPDWPGSNKASFVVVVYHLEKRIVQVDYCSESGLIIAVNMSVQCCFSLFLRSLYP